jgi:hypothetical protein
VVLGLDYATGGEGAALTVAEDLGIVSLIVNAHPGDANNQRLFAGTVVGEPAPGLLFLSDTTGSKIVRLPIGF